MILFVALMVALIFLARYGESANRPWLMLLSDALFGWFLLLYGTVSTVGVLVPRIGRIVLGEHWPGRFVDPQQRRLATRALVLRSTIQLMAGDSLLLVRLYPAWWSLLLGLFLVIAGGFIGLHACPLFHDLRRDKTGALNHRQVEGR